MRLRTLLLSASALVLVGTAGFAAARALQEGAPMGTPEPTAQHRWMQSFVGTWDATTTITDMPGSSAGTWTVEAGPGGLWLISHFKTEMMGMPFEGVELMGYDPATKTFTQVWADSMITSPLTMTGTYDEQTKTLTMKGEALGPDGQLAPMTNVSEYPDADTIHFSMRSPGPDGQEAEMMAITYKRRK